MASVYLFRSRPRRRVQSTRGTHVNRNNSMLPPKQQRFQERLGHARFPVADDVRSRHSFSP